MVLAKLTSLQYIARVAFHGELGSFSEEAALRLWPHAELVPLRTVAGVARAVLLGEADAGVLPVENTIAGGVDAALDAIASAQNIYAVAETILNIRQCLLALPGAALSGIEVVESHPVALAQCASFLARLPHVRERAAFDTAGAARAVSESRDPRRAAIASAVAARRYGLAILADHIEDRPDNQTRFLAISRSPVRVEQDTPARTSLMFTTANEPGALVRVLEPVAWHQLNLSRLEARPGDKPWTYRFSADIDHPAGDPRLDAVLALLEKVTQTCRVLGTYARATS